MDSPNTETNYAPVVKADFSSYQRVIAISDIHADYAGFQGVLKQLNFTMHDALVIVGDILEKGKHSLELLHAVMELIKQGNIYVVAGNNDIIFEEWYGNLVTNEDVHWYLHSREDSILIDMAKELQMPFDTLEDIEALKTAIEKHYKEELTFLCHLPYIIDSDIATFVHAGLKPGNLYTQDKEYCLTAKSFGEQVFRFEKPVIVGHWPASNYRETIIDINPYYNEATNVYSIDGGNSMKQWQQINYLIFDNNRTITNGYYDSLPKIKVLETQTGTDNPISLTFPNTALEIKEKGAKKSLCYLPYPDIELLISNSSIYLYKGKEYCSDFTTYYLPVEANDVVSLCGKVGNELLIKKNGIVGKYAGAFETL